VLKKLFLFFGLFAFILLSQSSAFDEVNLKLEVGIYSPELSGSIKNYITTTDLQKDLNYKDVGLSYAKFGSYFSGDFPNIEIDYFMVTQEAAASFESAKTLVSQEYNSSVYSKVDFKRTNITIYHDLKKKGRRIHLGNGKYVYPGDLEFDIGVNLKNFDYTFQIRDLTDTQDEYRFDRIDGWVVLPFIQAKYYYYRISLYANMSMLSYGVANTTTYNYGFDWKIIDRLYFGFSTMYERVEAKEKDDVIMFKLDGNKFSFKYIF